jgi:hypothetical protein
MPTRFVSQNVVPTDTPRTRNRIAYLGDLQPLVKAALGEHQRRKPNAEDYTLVGLRAVTTHRLRKLAIRHGRSFDTAKQDFGMLVPVVLVELFKAQRVLTLRENTSQAVATRRVSHADWPDLSDVAKFAPHRVVDDAGRGEERIILDTNIPKKHALNQSNALDPERLILSKGLHLVSLADGTVAELLYWFVHGGGEHAPFPRWKKTAVLFERLLDPEMPIAPGGHERAALSNLVAFPPSFSEAAFRSYSKATWRHLRVANSVEDVSRQTQFIGPDGRTYQLDLRPPATPLGAAAQRWSDLIARIGTLLADMPRDKRPSEDDLFKVVRDNVAAGRELGPDTVGRLQLPIRAMSRRAFEGMRHSPNPKKSNQALDFDLLFYPAMNAFVCSGDDKLVRFVRKLNCPDAKRVMTPRELLALLEEGRPPGDDVDV